MEDDLGTFHHEDDGLDRELHSLVREMEHEEAVRPDLAIPAGGRAVFTIADLTTSDRRAALIPMA